MAMIQPHSKGQKHIAYRIISHLLAIEFLANQLTCYANNDAISTTANTNKARTFRSLKAEFNLPISTPHFGGCFDSNTGQLTCTIDPTSCPFNTTYLKPNENDIQVCNSPHHVEIGRCASSFIDLESELGLCTPFPTSCKDSSLYTKSDNTCSIVKDKSTNSNKLTHYPHCREKFNINPDIPHRCVLSQDDCIDDREYFVATGELPYSEPCSCHDVPTGMCYSSSTDAAIVVATSFCAVTEYDCPTGYIFMSAHNANTIPNPPRLCRLCQKDDIDINELNEQGETTGTHENSKDQLNFISTPSAELMNGKHNDILDYDYDDYDDYDDRSDYDDSRNRFTRGFILVGSLGGSFLLTSGAVYFYKRDDLPAYNAADTSLDISEGSFI